MEPNDQIPAAQEIPEERRQAYLDTLRRLRPMDDSFMRKMFKDNIPLTELVLRIILDKDDLKVTRVVTQSDLVKLVGARSLSLDIDATDAEGRKIDLEVQRSDRGAGPKRARYHLSAMDVENLERGQDFDQLPETYVIFITENDLVGGGQPLYRIERINVTSGAPFQDEAHIVYVNGAYHGDNQLGRLMHDFRCSDPGDMYYDLMGDRAKYYKENPEGVSEMCREMESLWNKSREEGRIAGRAEGRAEGRAKGRSEGRSEERLNNIKSLMDTMQVSAEQAMNLLKIPVAERTEYSKLLPRQ